MESSVKRVRLDVSTACQLRCPSCPTTTGEVQRSLGTGFLRLVDFKQFLEHHPDIKEVELSNWGEIFLNPDLPGLLQFACLRGVNLTASNGVNLNSASPEMLEALVKYRFQHLTCSIDGATQESYSVYRQGGDLSKVLANIKTINEWKSIYSTTYPLLTWQFIVFRHNEHEIAEARELAKSLGMEFRLKLSWDNALAPSAESLHAQVITDELGIDVVNRSDYTTNYDRTYLQEQICSQLWEHPQINYDGKLLGCCVNYWSDFGNVFESGLHSLLQSEQYEYAKQMLQGLVPERDDIPCTQCSCYKQMKRTAKFFKPGLREAKLAFLRKSKSDWDVRNDEP